jgi:hypothetical protein
MPTLSVLIPTTELAATAASVWPTFDVLAVISLDCSVVIPVFKVLAAISLA